MPEYRFTSENDEYTEVVADANFNGQITSSEMLEILEVIKTVIHSEVGEVVFLEGLKSISITETSIALALRFKRNGTEKLTPPELDALPRKRAQFLMYCFATVDRIHALAETPFSPNFRFFADVSTWS
jgi:hypothetical protein